MEQNTMAVREQQWLETIQTAKKCCLPVNQWCCENGIAGCVFHKNRAISAVESQKLLKAIPYNSRLTPYAPLGGHKARQPAKLARSFGCKPRAACIWRSPFSLALKCGPTRQNPKLRRTMRAICVAKMLDNDGLRCLHRAALCLHSATAAPAPVRCIRRRRRSPSQHKVLSALFA